VEQLTTLSVKPGNQDSAAMSFIALKNELAEEKLTQEKAQTDTETLTQAIEELKKTTDQLIARVEELKKHLDNRVLDSLTEL
jgi:cell division protein FtsB